MGDSSRQPLDTQRDGTNAWRNRQVCPRGHPLQVPNLVACKLRMGHRECRACNLATGRLRWARARGEDVDLKTLADKAYAELAVGATPPMRTHESVTLRLVKLPGGASA